MMNKNNKILELEFNSDLSKIDNIVNKSSQFIEENCIEIDMFSFKLILFEVLVNAVKHGNKENFNLKVKYKLILYNDILQIEVEDEGEGFDWKSLLAVEEQDVTEDNGRGFLLMKAYEFTPSFNKIGNKITISKSFIQKPHSEIGQSEIKILVVEDDIATKIMMKKMMSKYGECETAENGEKGVEIVQSAIENDSHYDLICIDIMMPVMNGHDALKKIRALEKRNNIPATTIIMTSALNDDQNLLDAIKGKSDGYLTKPVNKQAIERLMNSLNVVPK